VQVAGQTLYAQFLTLASPRGWPAALDGSLNLRSLAVGLGCYWFWVFAILPRRHRIWYRRRGLRGAVRLLLAQARLSFAAPYICFLTAAGTLGVAGTWWLGGAHWAGLLTALVGLAGGGAIVWAVRVIGSVTLKKEAMGFGDVTLMMMIGTFVGWQASLIVFFLAPFAGLILGLIRLIFWRDHEIPYGPFLCLATLALIARWGDIWSWAQGMFDIPGLVPMAIAVCLLAMVLLLAAWRGIAATLLGRSH